MKLKNIVYSILVIILMLFLNGCTIKNDNSMEITKDGNVNYKVTLSFDKEIITNLIKSEYLKNDEYKEISNDDITAYLKDNIKDSYFDGFEKKDFINDDYVGYEYTLNIKNINDVTSDKEHTVILNNYSSEEKLKDLKLFTKKGKVYSANFKFDKMDLENDDLNVNLYTTFKVTLPSFAESSNTKNTSNNGKTLEWNFTGNNENIIKFSFKLKSNYIPLLIILFIGSLLSIIYYFIRFKDKSKLIRRIYIIISVVTIVIFSLLIYINYFRSEKVQSNKEITKTANIKLNDDKLEIDNNDIDKSLDVIKNYINISTEELNKNILNNSIKTDDTMTMTTIDNKKVLSAKLDETKYNILFNQYTSKYTENINVLFDTDNELAKEIDMKLNKETILRTKIVELAKKQVGKTGEDYWTWYGYGHRVEWCAVFVSWLGGQFGLIDENIYPKFVWVKIGVDFFKNNKQFKYRKEYTPKPGDVIFFDWNNNEVIDHVGVVEKVEDGYVYTVEGNVKYLYVANKKYKLNSSYIYGYGIPDYASYSGNLEM